MNSFLDSQRASAPEAASKIYAELQKLFASRLYYQLNIKLLELVKVEHFQQNQNLVKLYENFVSKFEKKGKAVDSARFCVAVSRQFPDASSSLAFLEKLLAESFANEDDDSKLLLNMEVVLIKIKLGRLEECKAVLEQAHAHIDARMGIADAVVSASYYNSAAMFHKVKGPAAQFFQNSLLYLAYTPLESISTADQVKWAVDVGLAALVGNNIYNFGELLQHPIINSLKGTEYAWLGDLLFAFNSGNIKAYQQIAEEKGINQEVLVKNAAFLNQKIRVMALMEMVFKRASDDRALSFKEISDVCILPVTEVELLLIKAFSLKVVKGTIDQVEQVVRIKYVQPRVLDKAQLETLRDRMRGWSQNVYQTALYVEDNASEIVRKPL